MRVAYDISVLGSGTLDPKARTGVFRVVENLAIALGGSGRCQLNLCAGGATFHPLFGALEYLDGGAALREYPFLSRTSRAELSAQLLSWLLAMRRELPAGFAERGLEALRGRAVSALANAAFPISRSVIEGADVFHSPYAPLPTSRRSDRPSVITIYDLIGVRWPELYEPHVEQHDRAIIESIRPRDVVTCISASTRDDLCNATGIDPDRVFVAPLAASPDLFHPIREQAERARVLERYRLPQSPYLLTVGTLKPVKNTVTTIRAFMRLVHQERIEDLNLVVAGVQGWDYAPIFDAVAEGGTLRDRVYFTGFVEDADLAGLYSGALAFVFPSLYEGFGLPALEAMQCGVPVVGSNTSSMPEVVGDGGILVPPTDVDAVAEALLSLYKDSATRANLADRALERSRLFSWDRCASETLKAYDYAISS